MEFLPVEFHSATVLWFSGLGSGTSTSTATATATVRKTVKKRGKHN